MKHSEHGRGVLKHCGPGTESCRPAPSHLMGKQAKNAHDPGRGGHGGAQSGKGGKKGGY